MKLRSLLAKCLLLVLLHGGYIAFSEIQVQGDLASKTILVADTPGTVYTQPAALLSATQQLQMATEQLGQCQQLHRTLLSTVVAKVDDEKQEGSVVRQFLRNNAYRISTFGSTDIISPFHQFF